MIHNKNKSIVIVSCLCAAFSLSSCSTNETEIHVIEGNEKNEAEEQTMRMQLNGGLLSFNIETNTRTDESHWEWVDGSVIYLQFYNDESVVRGHAQYSKDLASWEVYYSGSIGNSDKCEVYFFEGASNDDMHFVPLDETNAVYLDEDADYHITEDILYVNAILLPQTSRIKFAGSTDLGMTVQGITHLSGYDADQNKLLTSASTLSALVGTDGYTPYFYGVFSEESHNLIITNTIDSVWFSKKFGDWVFKVGESGILSIPTEDANRGWDILYPVSSIYLSSSSISIQKRDTTMLSFSVLPENSFDKSVKWESCNPQIAQVDSLGKVVALSSGRTTISVTSVIDETKNDSCTVIVYDTNGHDYVDLGLPSGILWATCNVGADSPEEYGDYYAWGELYTKDSYQSYNYTYNYGNMPNPLPLSRDAAHYYFGGDWRMPTYVEILELRQNCSRQWEECQGVYGRKVTGSNGASIFLPAAGYFQGSSKESGEHGYYWTSTPYTTHYPHILDFSSDSFSWNNFAEYCGLPIRPVCSTK